MKLNIGSGPQKLSGYVNVDIRKELNPDVVCDIKYLEPFEDNSVDEIKAHHVLEHFQQWLTRIVLRKWCEKLKPDGLISIEVPDMKEICRAVHECNYDNINELNARFRDIYGGQDHPWNYHCTGFTQETLTKHLESCGFVVSHVIRLKEPHFCIRVEARKKGSECKLF